MSHSPRWHLSRFNHYCGHCSKDSQCFSMDLTNAKSGPTLGYLDPQTWFLQHIRVSLPSSISIGSTVLAQLNRVTNIQTDTQTMLRATTVAISNIYGLEKTIIDD